MNLINELISNTSTKKISDVLYLCNLKSTDFSDYFGYVTVNDSIILKYDYGRDIVDISVIIEPEIIKELQQCKIFRNDFVLSLMEYENEWYLYDGGHWFIASNPYLYCSLNYVQSYKLDYEFYKRKENEN